MHIIDIFYLYIKIQAYNSVLLLQLKKDYHTAPFPPKRVRNTNPKVLEHRRVALEVYMQKMLRLTSTKQQVLNFLGINEDNVNNRHRY